MTRLAEGGALIDRTKPVSFKFDGKTYQGFAGDTLASAMLANGVKLVGRSYKYHRPRGVVTSGPEEPNALVNLGSGPTHEPNVRMTQVPLFEGLEATSQNRFPSLNADIGVLNALASKLYPAGFYYKTFIHPRVAWKHLFEPVIRNIAGLGRAPSEADPDTYEHQYAFCDVLIAGGGAAGLLAARKAGEAGARVMLVEQTERLGGRMLVDDDAEIDGKSAVAWVAEQVIALEAMDNVTIRLNTCASAAYDHGYTMLYERRTDDRKGTGPRHRLWRVRTKQIIAATGMIERPIAFYGNDVPGVMLASAVRDYVKLWGVAPGRNTVVYTVGDDGYRTALSLHAAGHKLSAVLDVREDPVGMLVEQVRGAGIKVMPATGIGKVIGGKAGVTAIKTVSFATGKDDAPLDDSIPCDCVAMAGGWSPVVHLYSHSGGKVLWDAKLAMYRPDANFRPTDGSGEGFVHAAGGANGELQTQAVLKSAAEAASGALSSIGMTTDTSAPTVAAVAEQPMQPTWFTPTQGKASYGGKHFLDYQNDVTVADIRLAAREGYESVEHAKRYTTLGMATDQGKLSNINGHAILADALGKAMPEVGTTTFRPPYTPISMGSIAGREKGILFKPVRETVMHNWHAAQNAEFEPVGDWRRPYRYQQGNEAREPSIHREIARVREAVGLLDASTLGKIIVKGPDAGKFLNMMYTNMMSTLKPGKCRYGLMCNDNGFLMDDGVVARLDEDTFLCHTTSGGSDRVHAWMEEWLQTEWFDLKVYTANVTEQWAQFAVAGPNARKLLERFEGDTDLSGDALPFMGFTDGVLDGLPVRIFRISFSGELSFEIATPTSYGPALWEALMSKGEDLGVGPYGTEALHVLRAEKGFIVVGDETDGTVTPHDVGMSWAVSKKKEDFIGKRAMMRSDLTREGRKQLVGLLTTNPRRVLPDGAHAMSADGTRAIGHVTSTYYSPTLKRSIAMALIEDGQSMMGQTLTIGIDANSAAKAVVSSPVFYDEEGARQNV